MLRARAGQATAGLSVGSGAGNGGVGNVTNETGGQWEMRPGGMLVQKRNPDSDQISGHPPPPPIRVRVKYGSIYHEIRISSQASFGELKKLLTGPTGLHHEDQKLFFKDKERDSKAFLDLVGVKDRSKMVVVEDPVSHERRLLELRKTAKMEKAAKSISQISFEVDRLAGRISALDSIISKGGKVVETDLLGLVELLMNQLLKLDGIVADGDVKLQRKMQVKRVQKYVETVDALKIKNASLSNNNSVGDKPNGVHNDNNNKSTDRQQQQKQQFNNGQTESDHRTNHRPQAVSKRTVPAEPRRSSSSETVVTTQWETFDLLAAEPQQVPAHAVSTSSIAAANRNPPQQQQQPKFPWEFFDQ